MKMDERQLVALVDAEFESAMGAPGQEISNERASALDFYLSKPFGNEVEGRSSVVTTDVADVINSIMPSLLRVFTTADNLVSFEAVGPEDEPAAQQESDYVNYIFFKQNPAFELMYCWMFDALVQKNGIVKSWWEETEHVTQESYQGLTEDELAQLILDPELKPLERSEPRIELLGGVEVEVQDIVFNRHTKGGKICVQNVPPEEYRISSDARSVNPCEARMVGHEREMKRSDLIEMGFDRKTVEELPAHGFSTDSEERRSRQEREEERTDTDFGRDKSQDLVRVREAYIKVDYDGDGVSELRQVFISNGKLLSNEAADRQPFHVLCPRPHPHKHFGGSIAEDVMDIQLINSTLLRQTLDNIYLTNRPKNALWEQGLAESTEDDLATAEIGGNVLFRRPVNESWAPMTVPFTAGNTFTMLEYWDKAKRDRTGIGSDSEGLSPDSLKNIQQSVMAQAHDVGKMKIEAVARIFAETGFKSLFLHIHELARKYQDKEQIIKLRNEWVPVNPSGWHDRTDMTVNIGLGIGTRDQNLVHNEAIYQRQKDIVDAGGMEQGAMTLQHVFHTNAELVKNANMKNPELFFPNPQNAQPPEEKSDPQAELAQAQMQILQQENEIKAERNQIEVEKARMQHQREIAKLEQQREKDQADADAKFEALANQVTELELKYSENVPGAKV